MTTYEVILAYLLLIVILIMTALTYRHVTEQRQVVEAKIEYLAEKIDRKVDYRRQETKRFSNEWRESNADLGKVQDK